MLPYVVAYGVASLLHHVHNAEFLADYPNLPPWLTPTGVYAAWFAVTAVGVAGYGLLRAGSRRAGLAVLAGYAALGFAGLDHYAVAPLRSHGAMMNLTIGLEVASASLLLLVVARTLIQQPRIQRRRGA